MEPSARPRRLARRGRGGRPSRRSASRATDAARTRSPRRRHGRAEGVDDRRGAHAAGRAPRKASVTWRCSRATTTARRELLRAASARGRRASASGSSSARKSRRRSSPPTLAAEVIRLRADFVSEPRARGAAPQRSRARGSPPGRRAARTAGAFSPSGADGVEEDEADGLLRRAAARSRDAGHGDPDVDAKALADAGRHRRGHLGRDCAVLGRTVASATPSSRVFTSFAYATTAPAEDVARPRNVGQAGRDQPAGARLGRREPQPARAAELEHDLRDRPLVLAEQVALERRAQGGARARRRAPPRPAPRRGRRGSRSHARRSSPRPRRRLRRPRRAHARPPTRSTP